MEIRWYYKVIAQSKKWIIIISLIPTLVALSVSLVIPPTYEAETGVLLFKSKSNVSFDPRFETISEDDLIRLSGQDPRRQTLAALAVSDQVLSQTWTALPAEVQAEWTLQMLKEKVHVGNVGNLLQLSVQTKDPEEAAQIANLWAQVFVRQANQAYTQPAATIDTVVGQTQQKHQLYQTTEQALITFLEENAIGELQFNIDLKTQALKDIQSVYQSAARTGLIKALLTQQEMPILLASLQNLRDKIAPQAGETLVDPVTQTALILLIADAFTLGADLPVNIQLLLSNTAEFRPTTVQTLEATDQVLAALHNLQIEAGIIANQQVEVVVDVLQANENLLAEIKTLNRDLNQMKSALETELAVQKELIANRDRAWEDYLTLSRKEAELTISAQTEQTEVVVAAEAMAPEKPVAPVLLLNVGIGLAFGLLASLAVVFVRAYLDETPLPKGEKNHDE